MKEVTFASGVQIIRKGDMGKACVYAYVCVMLGMFASGHTKHSKKELCVIMFHFTIDMRTNLHYLFLGKLIIVLVYFIGHCMYIIAEGRVSVLDDDRVIDHLGVGDVFGEVCKCTVTHTHKRTHAYMCVLAHAHAHTHSRSRD